MQITSVTSKGQVTIPKPLRQRLGLRQGSKVQFILVGDHVEMRVVSRPADVVAAGFRDAQEQTAGAAGGIRPIQLAWDREARTRQMIGLDTSVLARYNIGDEGDKEASRQSAAARRLMESGKPLAVCKTALLELEWVNAKAITAFRARKSPPS